MFFIFRNRQPPRSTLDRWSAASDGYKRQGLAESTAEYERELASEVDVHDPEGEYDLHASRPT